jgi:hypothetical protein
MPLTALGGASGTVVIGDTTTTVFPQTLHPNVMAYVAAQTANGYSPSRTRVDALNNLVWGLVANGIWDKCQAIYPFLGGTTAAAQKWNIKDVQDTNGAFRLTFNGSWTFAETGIKTVTALSTNYARTYYTPSANATNDSGHLTAYIRNQFTGTGCVIGAINGFLATSVGFQIFASTGISGTTIQARNVTDISNYGTSAAGMYSGNRSSSTSQEAYYNGLLKSQNSNASSLLSSATSELTIAARNDGGFAMESPNNAEIAFTTIGQSLSALEQKFMYQIVQTYQTTLGRQV